MKVIVAFLAGVSLALAGMAVADTLDLQPWDVQTVIPAAGIDAQDRLQLISMNQNRVLASCMDDALIERLNHIDAALERLERK